MARCSCVARWVLSAASFLVVSAASAADLTLSIRDSKTGWLLPARVRIRDSSGRDHVAPGSQVVQIGPRDQWFVSAGRSQLSVPPGTVEIRVERGPEYSPIKESIILVDDRPTAHEATLRRWINMRERGYLCGENHLHVPLDELGPQLVAEGLDFGTFLQWWNGPKDQVFAGEGFIRTLRFAGCEVPTSVYDVEIERQWGAAYLIGVPEPLDAEPRRNRPNLPLVREAHKAGALVCYQGGWSREVLVDALLGHVDVVNVCNNNFHRHRFQPRSRYSNLLGVEGLPDYPDTPEGMMQMNTDTYYRLLNCGLRLAAGAGSATGAKCTPVGYNRTYVRVREVASLPEFLSAWRMGRNLVTCGPMIFLRIDGKYEPGDTIELDIPGRELSVKVEAAADQPITSLEIVVNGQALDVQPTIEGHRALVSTQVPIREGSWIAARCTEEDRLLSDAELQAYDTGQEAQPCRLRFAHTSPIYVTVNGKGARVPASVREAEKMLDAFEVFADKNAGSNHRDQILAEVKTARRRLAELE
ncbi:MAG TPA: CehA/McbA family metallohydrolase [Phycisphaerae bacterium]|nr:CehA/McbA family metallohydrolase [Phycisphaerae bacterium]